MIEREDVSEYREAAWQEQLSHETMRQVSETTVTEETRKISSSSDHQEQDRDSSPYSSDEDQEGVRSKEIKHHHEEETIEETNEQVWFQTITEMKPIFSKKITAIETWYETNFLLDLNYVLYITIITRGTTQEQEEGNQKWFVAW